MRFVQLCVVSVVALSLACGGGGSQPNHPTSGAATILANVPADSPYLMASFDEIAPAIRQRMMRGVDKQMAELSVKLDEVGDVNDDLAPWLRAVRSLRNEVKGKEVADWGKEVGFDPKGRFVVYGLSIWPVARIELADPVRLRSVIQRALSAARVKLEEGSLSGRSYWIANAGEMAFIAAVLEREAVVALLPRGAVQGALPLVLGIEKPAKNLGSTQVVAEVLARHRFQGSFVGYFDTRNLIDVFTAPRTSELEAPLRAAIGQLPPACRTDLERLSALVPRIALGYRKLDESGWDGAMVFETASSVTSALGKLHSAVPELSPAQSGSSLFSFGAALNAVELVAWVRSVAAQLRQQPFACPWFAPLNQAGDHIGNQLSAVPPMFQGLRGFAVAVDRATVMPPSVDGHMIIAGDGIADTVASLSALIPWLAGVPLKRDGRPVELPAQQLGLPISGVHVAMTSDRVVIASGAASAKRATDHLATPAPKRSPLVMLTFDAARLQTLLQSMGETDTADFGHFGNVGMSLEVVDAGLSLGIWGTWPPAQPKP